MRAASHLTLRCRRRVAHLRELHHTAVLTRAPQCRQVADRRALFGDDVARFHEPAEADAASLQAGDPRAGALGLSMFNRRQAAHRMNRAQRIPAPVSAYEGGAESHRKGADSRQCQSRCRAWRGQRRPPGLSGLTVETLSNRSRNTSPPPTPTRFLQNRTHRGIRNGCRADWCSLTVAVGVSGDREVATATRTGVALACAGVP